MGCNAPKMRNTHFTTQNEDAQCALRHTHQNSTIPRMTVGEKIRAIRIAKKMTLAEVEGRAGLTDGNLSRIERGKQWVSEEVLRNIAQALLVHVADFFNDIEMVEAHVNHPHPVKQELQELLRQTGDEVRLLTVYRLASADDRTIIDAAVDDVVERLDIVGILNKRK